MAWTITLAALFAMLLYVCIKIAEGIERKKLWDSHRAFHKKLHDDMEYFKAESDKFKPLNLTPKYR